MIRISDCVDVFRHFRGVGGWKRRSVTTCPLRRTNAARLARFASPWRYRILATQTDVVADGTNGGAEWDQSLSKTDQNPNIVDGDERIHLAREVNASTPLWNDGLRFFALVGGVGLVCKLVFFAGQMLDAATTNVAMPLENRGRADGGPAFGWGGRLSRDV